MTPSGVLPEAELDADERQEEILAHTGIYNLPGSSGLRGKFLIVFGVVITILGAILWHKIGGISPPAIDLLGVELGLALAIFLALLGLGCLIDGILLVRRNRRDFYEMKLIRWHGSSVRPPDPPGPTVRPDGGPFLRDRRARLGLPPLRFRRALAHALKSRLSLVATCERVAFFRQSRSISGTPHSTRVLGPMPDSGNGGFASFERT